MSQEETTTAPANALNVYTGGDLWRIRLNYDASIV